MHVLNILLLLYMESCTICGTMMVVFLFVFWCSWLKLHKLSINFGALISSNGNNKKTHTVFWNVNLITFATSSNTCGRIGFRPGSILDQSGGRKVVQATLKHPLVPNGYIPGMSLTCSTLHPCTFVHTG